MDVRQFGLVFFVSVLTSVTIQSHESLLHVQDDLKAKTIILPDDEQTTLYHKAFQTLLPGFKSRVTLKGLIYVDQIAMDLLSNAIKTATVPDQHGGTGVVKYDLTGFRVTGFSPPQSSINLIPGSGITWAGNGAKVSMYGNFHYKLAWIIPIEDSGSFDISINGLSFSINAAFGVDSGGRPSVAASGCNCDISSVDITFHGGMAWLYNLFTSLIEPSVRDSLKGTVCSSVTSLINDNGEKELASLSVTIEIANMFLLDYRLIQTPTFTTTYLETYHKGEIFWLNNITEAPFQPAVMADTAGDDKMMYFWLSDYIFNTMGLVAQQHNVLNYNLTAQDLPPDQRGILNTTCTSAECLGILVPQVGKLYPNSSIELHMFSCISPKMTITPNDISVSCSGKIVFYARQKNNSLPSLFTLMADMQAFLNVSVAMEKIYGKVNDIKLAINVTDSAVGDISSVVLQIIIDQVLKSYLIPTLNDIGQKGFPLPVFDGVSFVNSNLILMQDVILVGTDIQYQGQIFRH
uniref:Bactericidal/permeability-increasing protein 2 n=1 Tax=Sinohyriopsis cumingii TaxID=165450 RepID=A0A1Z1G775_SINCU|nr:bactericidal/permeability-increasing protein 2 [Sinohyriopsis cumingii]